MRPHTTLISPAAAADHLGDPTWAFVDCRFSLRDPGAGRTAYLAGHVPGAVYAHLDDDLSGPVRPGVTGRHPLPPAAEAAAAFGRWGIDDGVQVVAYDDAGGALAARCWWMLRWLGHDAVAVLDGGWSAWHAGGLPTREGGEEREARTFPARERPHLVADADLVDEARENDEWRVLDARGADRYRGENETMDPVAGHIPGAESVPFADNLDDGGTMKPAGRLAERFRSVMGGVPADRVITYCGSGVTAAHNVLAMVHAGVGEPKLYVGSWSEWIAEPNRPIAAGA